MVCAEAGPAIADLRLVQRRAPAVVMCALLSPLCAVKCSAVACCPLQAV
jgi:hypothetical protein